MIYLDETKMLLHIKKFKETRALEKRLKIRKWKYIGRGLYGKAYDIGHGLVCKITTNLAEAKAASKVKRTNKKTSSLYKVLDVIYLKRRSVIYYALIITPKYNELNPKEITELCSLFQSLEVRKPRFCYHSISQVKKIIYDSMWWWGYPENVRQIETDKRIKILKKYGVVNMLKNLQSLKLPPTDVHAGNIMKNGKKYVLIDIGC